MRRVIARVDDHLRARLARLLENYDRLDRRLPIILVGGGAPLILHLLRELGRQVESPVDAAVANAYGAAMAQVGGEADLTFPSSVPRAEAMAKAEAEAHRRAEEAGARPGTIRTVELEDAALTYLASEALKVHARAVGDIGRRATSARCANELRDSTRRICRRWRSARPESSEPEAAATPTTGNWSRGRCSAKAPRYASSMSPKWIPRHSPSASAVIGAPLVCLEKPPSLPAMQVGFDSVASNLNGEIGAFFAGEIGGLQCMFPLMLAAETGQPLLDGDAIGRAFPELQMCTFMIYGTTPGLPMALSYEGGMLLDAKERHHESSPRHSANEPAGIEVERRLRKICSDNGGLIYMTTTFDHESLTRTLIRGSIALALALGRAVEAARAARRDPIAAIVEAGGGRRFIGGKVIDVERQFRAGHDWGTVRLEGVEADQGRLAEVAFKNEYLILKIGAEVALTVPDLITLVETETGNPVTTEILRPGLRVSVLGLPCSPLMRTEKALLAVGPKAFGYDLPYISLAGV